MPQGKAGHLTVFHFLHRKVFDFALRKRAQRVMIAVIIIGNKGEMENI